ncbi:PP2C family protein-serine/threonine phosphatase [Streptomyces sp. NBC_00083]|uniref:PP2C family protein-serine/threonine phosphatase n=1 Tax=Streptomyces sp. NBC_00083 TaxID=2975647 RepID=UPI002253B92C|nr:PP2C family protein-serine/threonine phosphatase [Streptomyces sp. NBC_00083]MCX5387199.1 serine/threonine-protein phosphatase [Streptomyces sp. NBC_00083]
MGSEDTWDSGCGERLLEDLLAQAHSATPMDLPVLVNRCAEAFGLGEVVIYLTDLQQRSLVGLTDGLATLDIDASVAGWCYRTVSLRIEDVEAGILCLWLPVVDGAERLGVLGVRTRSVDAVRLRRCRMLTGIVAMAITSKRAYSDSFARRARAERMQLPAEMLRAFLPPRTIGNAHVVSTAVLEPAYEIGGDAFDHSLTQSTLHAAILDAMGHDLASGLTTSVALAGCRNARRAGAGLLDLVETIDQALAQWLPDKYCTGILTQLDLASGLFSWCNCGHPPPVLIRDGRVVAGALERTPQPPMGLPARFSDDPRAVHELKLEPGDRVLLYTDGVTEARTVGGGEFGMDRFTDSIILATASGELAAESLRRLIHAILDTEDSDLRDDATMLLIEWWPPTTKPGEGAARRA